VRLPASLPPVPDPGLSPWLGIWKSLLEADPSVVSVTAAYTATALDHTVLCDASGAALTVTLPPAADNKGKVLVVKKTDASANAVTVDGAGAETIQGAASVSLGAQWASRTLQSDGANWIILAST
jgi:hypothetical protein